MPDDEPRFLTLAEAAERVGVKAATIRSWIHRGQLATIDLSKFGKSRRLNHKYVDIADLNRAERARRHADSTGRAKKRRAS
jgi:excisionase family DNA binding protein